MRFFLNGDLIIWKKIYKTNTYTGPFCMFSLGSAPLPKDSWSRFQPPPLHVETDKKKPTARQSQRNKHLAGGVATYLRHVSLRYE